ncbi:hypothetical protein LJB42_004263 [Komagataella kurtzmanii]|nr:hypothetical protein LJB42_004263 [Komagataella kurtzmanii]
MGVETSSSGTQHFSDDGCVSSRKPNATVSFEKPERTNELKNHKIYKKFKASWLQRNQILLASSLLNALFILKQIPSSQSLVNKFFHLQYKNLDGTYDIGKDDYFFVIYWIINLTIIRSVLMDWVLEPLAIKIVGINNRKALTRFKEQGWSLFYYTTSWTVGFYLYYKSDYFFNCDHIFIGWPNNKLDFYFKSYYLIQMSCWLQQIVVLNIEERRKDYVQMFSHHIITCLLIIGSYYYYFLQIGHVILVMMDIVDVFLSLAKMLKYCGYSTLCDVMFFIFLVSWIAIRHVCYNYVFWHTCTKSRDLMNADCSRYAIYGGPLDVTPVRCYTDSTIRYFMFLLGGLQIITLIWMYLILKVFIGVITGKNAEDVRSDDEESS